MKVASGKLEALSIFGNDYETEDGTCRRDFIHVVDLANGHVKALNHLGGLKIYNLGSGKPVSVLELVTTFEKVNNLKLNYRFEARRDGDIDTCYASCQKAKEELGWTAEKTIEDMCKDSWNYIEKNS